MYPPTRSRSRMLRAFFGWMGTSTRLGQECPSHRNVSEPPKRVGPTESKARNPRRREVTAELSSSSHEQAIPHLPHVHDDRREDSRQPLGESAGAEGGRVG